MRGDRVVIQYGLCRVHQLLAVLDMTRVTGQRVHHPELCQGQRDGLILPAHRHAIDIQLQAAAIDAVLITLRILHDVQTPE